MQVIKIGCTLALLGLAALCSTAHAAPPAVSTTFELDPGGWQIVNPLTGIVPAANALMVVHEPALIKEGKGSLKYNYTVNKGTADLLILPITSSNTTPISNFHFWIHPDHSASFLFVAAIKGRNRYQTTFAAKGNSWQEVTIALTDLIPSDEDVKAGGKQALKPIQADQIENIGLIDTDCYLIQIFGDTAAPITFNTGQHTVLLSPFSARTDQVAMPVKQAPGVQALTPMLRPQVDWMVIGNAGVEKSSDLPLAGAGVKVTYKQEMGKIVALMKGIPQDTLTIARYIKINVASRNATTVVVQLEEAGGGKYKATINLDAGSHVKEYTLNISEFTPTDDNKDANNKLDLDEVNKLMLIDLGGALGGATGENTLWFNGMRSVK